MEAADGPPPPPPPKTEPPPLNVYDRAVVPAAELIGAVTPAWPSPPPPPRTPAAATTPGLTPACAGRPVLSSPPRTADTARGADAATAGAPSRLAAQLQAGLAALEAGEDFDMVERALAKEDAAARAAEEAALAAIARLGA